MSGEEIRGNEPQRYRIVVEGKICDDWSDWLNGMRAEIGAGLPGGQTTILTGTVTDQAALRGILCRLWDLNLAIVSVQRLDPDWNGFAAPAALARLR